MSKYEIYIPKSKEDRERAVLPTIVYGSDGNQHIKVSIIALGWWKWGIALKRTTQVSESGE